MNLFVIEQNFDLLQTQIGMPTSDLASVANDYLRFTMHFFQLIQQSAQHIYHSALPLSPNPSIFPSMSLPGQTRISKFYGRPDNWGSVVRTITSISGDLTCTTTIGRGSTAKIAAACNDGTVRIYDSVTGVLRLSLRPEFPILEMTGVPDGSLLVCTHSGRPFITLWDIQTGGLVQTFILKEEVKHTTVSLKGRYLACETSERAVNFWETASRTRHPDPLENFEGNIHCWLAPEELIMVVDRGSAYIRNVVTKGPPVHKFDLSRTAHSAVYSQISNLLVIMSPYFLGHSFVILDVKTGASSTLYSGKRLSSIAFSQTTKQLVCGGEVPGLETVDIPTGCWTHFNFPATVTSVSTLSNGTVVANVRGSGIQLLSLDQEYASSPRLTPPALTAYPLDKGRIITIVLATNDHVTLLETATMLQVLSIPTQKGDLVATGYTAILCASLENKIAVCCSKKGAESYLQVWEFFHQHPRWTVSMGSFASVSGISPACTRVVTFNSGGERGSVNVWGASEGRLLQQDPIIRSPDAPRPLDIIFDSEDRFYIHYNTHREPYDIRAWFHPDDPTARHSITRREGQPLEGQVLEKRYRLDSGHEWVLFGSERICWVPPGYIGSAPASHWWAGSSLVMVGQDGTLRKLTLLEPSL